ncbi:MAG: hypothetical protein ACOCUY_02830 [Verrucomicrobiota bacterium]
MKYIGFILAIILSLLALQVHQSSKQSIAEQKKRNQGRLEQNRKDVNESLASQNRKLEQLEERFVEEKQTSSELQKKLAALIERKKQLEEEIDSLENQLEENRELVDNFAGNRDKYVRSIKKAQELLSRVEDDIELLEEHIARVSTSWEK